MLTVGTSDQVDLAGDNGAGADHDPDFDDLTITSIDGVAVAPGESVTLASGLRVTLIDGTEVSFDAPGIALRLAVGDSFQYEVSDGRGGSDSATVTVDLSRMRCRLRPSMERTASASTAPRLMTSAAIPSPLPATSTATAIDDLIVGAPGADTAGGYDAGASYVVFGTDAGFAASLDLAALDGSDGFRLDGAAADD